jgi:hypothetical protein
MAYLRPVGKVEGLKRDFHSPDRELGILTLGQRRVTCLLATWTDCLGALELDTKGSVPCANIVEAV